MRKLPLRFIKRAILAMAPFILFSCEKPNDTLGSGQFYGDTTNLRKVTFPVITYPVNVDSIAVSFSYSDQLLLGGYGGNRLVGSITDGVFGKNEASFVSQVFLDEVGPDFGTNPVVDSVNLYLRYNGSYGDTGKPVSLDVYELNEALSRDTVFYSNYNPVIGDKIGGKDNFIPKPNTPAIIEGEEVLPTLTIPLSKDFIQQKIADHADGSFSSLASNDDFVDYFKGFQLEATNQDGAILYFNLNSNNSRIVIYYHNDSEDSLTFDMSFISESSSAAPINFNIFHQDYSGAYPTSFNLAAIDTTNGEPVTYVEAMGGVATMIKIPGLKQLLDSVNSNKEILINQAVLKMHKQQGTGFALKPPTALEIRHYTDGGPGATITDFNTNNYRNSDGYFASGIFKDGTYSFNMTRHIFDVLNSGKNPELVIVPVSKSTVADRVILQGGNTPDSNRAAELTVYYTNAKP